MRSKFYILFIFILFIMAGCDAFTESFAPAEIVTDYIFFNEDAIASYSCDDTTLCMYGCNGISLPDGEDVDCAPREDEGSDLVIDSNLIYYVFAILPDKSDDRRYYYTREDGREIHKMIKELLFTVIESTDDKLDHPIHTKKLILNLDDIDCQADTYNFGDTSTDCETADPENICVNSYDDNCRPYDYRPEYPTIASWDGVPNYTALNNDDNSYSDLLESCTPLETYFGSSNYTTVKPYLYILSTYEELTRICTGEITAEESTLASESISTSGTFKIFLDVNYFPDYKETDESIPEPLNTDELILEGDSNRMSFTITIPPSHEVVTILEAVRPVETEE